MPPMPEQQAHRQHSVRRAARWASLAVWLSVVSSCAPEAPPIERGSGSATVSEAAPGAGAPAAPSAVAGRGAPTPSAPALANGRRPDVLLVSLDTLRADALSCYGNPRPTSPFLDALASRGVRFANCYAPTPHTAPSHVSLLSGLLPLAHGVPNASAESKRLARLNENWPTLTQLLAADGFQTVFVCNGGQLRREMGIERAVEQFDSSTKTFAAAIDVVDEMLADVDPNEPLFTFVHTYEPHAPYLPPRRVNGAPLHGRFTDRKYRGVLRRTYDTLIGRVDEGAGLAAEFLADSAAFTPEDVEFLIGLYHEDVLYTDIQLARLVKTWSRHRDFTNTIVVVVSDHGEQLGENGAFGHRYGLGVELVHVPFVARGPGIEPRVDESVVSLAHVAAAILEHVGVGAPEHLQRGAVLASPTSAGSLAHLQDSSGAHAALGVVEGPLHYLRGIGGNRALGESVRDLAADRRGRTEVALSPTELTRLRRLVNERQRADQDLRTSFPTLFDALPTRGQSDMLRDLGYSEEAATDETPAVETGDGRGGDRK
jgi:arylsulfatase A-like enzyme